MMAMAAGNAEVAATGEARFFSWIKGQTESEDAQAQRHDFAKRLQTFHVSTFAAKPPCLSPLLCARFGWCNADEDMLSCPTCGAALSIEIPKTPSLGPKIIGRIVAKYREQLVKNHHNTCPFSRDMASLLYLNTSDSATTALSAEPSSVVHSEHVPIIYASVFPMNCVEFMDHPHPENLLECRVRDFLAAKELSSRPNGNTASDGSEDSPASKMRLDVNVPSEIRRYAVDGGADGVATMEESEFLTLTAAAAGLGTEADDAGIDTELCLALLGWTPDDIDPTPPIVDVTSRHRQPSRQSESCLRIKCSLCLSQRSIQLVECASTTTGGHEDDEPADDMTRPTKRVRRELSAPGFHPITSHRYYCPMVCGFPQNTVKRDKPMWKVIADRICRNIQSVETKASQRDGVEASTTATSDEAPGYDASIDRIRRILRGGLYEIPATSSAD